METSRAKHAKAYVTLALGFCEKLFYSGIVYGWAALVYVLKEEGFYSHLCQNQTSSATIIDEVKSATPSSCQEQDATLNLVYTVSSYALQGSMALSGILHDNLGTRFTRITMHLLHVSGFAILLISSPALPELLFPGMILLGLGGAQFIHANMQISNLFVNKRATVTVMLVGAFDSSAAMFVFFKLSYDNGVSLQTSFTIIIAMSSLLFINTFILLPVDHIHHKDSDPSNIENHKNGGNVAVIDDKEVLTDRQRHRKLSCVSRKETETARNLNFPTLKSCVRSPFFILLILWYTILLLRTVYYVGTLNPYLTQITNNDEQLVSHYTEVFSYLQLGGVLTAPALAWLLDRNKYRMGKSPIRKPYADLQDSISGFVLVTVLFLLLSISNLIPILEVQYFTFCMQVVTRTFLYGILMAVIQIMFPGRFFASLFGILSTVGSFGLLLQFPLFLVTQHVFNGDPLVINIVFLCACFLTFAMPLYIYIYVKRNRPKAACGDEKQGHVNEGIDLSATWS